MFNVVLQSLQFTLNNFQLLRQFRTAFYLLLLFVFNKIIRLQSTPHKISEFFWQPFKHPVIKKEVEHAQDRLAFCDSNLLENAVLILAYGIPWTRAKSTINGVLEVRPVALSEIAVDPILPDPAAPEKFNLKHKVEASVLEILIIFTSSPDVDSVKSC